MDGEVSCYCTMCRLCAVRWAVLEEQLASGQSRQAVSGRPAGGSMLLRGPGSWSDQLWQLQPTELVLGVHLMVLLGFQSMYQLMRHTAAWSPHIGNNWYIYIGYLGCSQCIIQSMDYHIPVAANKMITLECTRLILSHWIQPIDALIPDTADWSVNSGYSWLIL